MFNFLPVFEWVGQVQSDHMVSFSEFDGITMGGEAAHATYGFQKKNPIICHKK